MGFDGDGACRGRLPGPWRTAASPLGEEPHLKALREGRPVRAFQGAGRCSTGVMFSASIPSAWPAARTSGRIPVLDRFTEAATLTPALRSTSRARGSPAGPRPRPGRWGSRRRTRRPGGGAPAVHQGLTRAQLLLHRREQPLPPQGPEPRRGRAHVGAAGSEAWYHCCRDLDHQQGPQPPPAATRCSSSADCARASWQPGVEPGGCRDG